MDFFNKAKQAADKYSGGGSSSHKPKDKKKDSTYAKAMDAAEKYHAKEKAVDYAQKRVAKRGEPGYVVKKDKSSVDKAVEAAEDFLAKQGQPKPHHADAKQGNQKEDLFSKAKGAMGQFGKKF